jgi:hypothetical protein
MRTLGQTAPAASMPSMFSSSASLRDPGFAAPQANGALARPSRWAHGDSARHGVRALKLRIRLSSHQSHAFNQRILTCDTLQLERSKTGLP